MWLSLEQVSECLCRCCKRPKAPACSLQQRICHKLPPRRRSQSLQRPMVSEGQLSLELHGVGGVEGGASAQKAYPVLQQACSLELKYADPDAQQAQACSLGQREGPQHKHDVGCVAEDEEGQVPPCNTRNMLKEGLDLPVQIF